MTSPNIDFRRIRGHGAQGSQADGFEELVCQLVPRLMDVPPDSRVTRFGNPDGGREMRVELSDGDVWAVQAKYLFELTSDEIGQVTKSVIRALDREPRLTRYAVVLPYDRPGGDTSKMKSAWTRWQAAVTRWQDMASKRGMSVSFEYVGLHELMGALTPLDAAGRLRYWFDVHVFDADSQRRTVDRVVADAGPRYSPEVHVDLPVAAALDALGHTEAYATVVRRLLASLRAARRYGWRAPEGHAEEFAPLLSQAASALDGLDATLVQVIAAITGGHDLLPDVDVVLGSAGRTVNEVQRCLRECCLSKNGYYVGDAATLSVGLRNTAKMLDDLGDLVEGPSWAASRRRVLLLTGEGGTGKTHLLCDAAQRRMKAGAPTLITLGQQFNDGPLPVQLAQLVGFEGPPGELLATLNAAAESTGRRGMRGMVMIDALNESQSPDLWKNHLAGLLTDVLRYPWLTLVVSCRTPFVDQVVPETVRERAAVLVHHGFEETGPDAAARYLRHYGLEEPSFPVLHPELTNPLFLRLACAVTRARGLPGLPRDGFGFGAVFGGYLDVIGERLAGESRCDYDPTDRLVQQAVRQLASAAEHGSFTKPQADRITNALLPNRKWARSLLKGMLDEGLLLRTASGDHERVRFGYERVGDLAAASVICEQSHEQAVEAVRDLAGTRYVNAGLLRALSVLLPETHHLEVADVASDGGGVDAVLLEMLLASLALRRTTSVSQRTVELVDQIVDTDDCWQEVYCAVLLVAAVPGHGLNADWLHRHLLSLGIVERDLTWTTMCNDDRPGALDVLVDWAWSIASAGADDEVARLAATTLARCLTSSNRRLRDRSTKALVHLLQQRPAVLVQVLAAFEGVDDPYVEERLLAVAAGVAARCRSREGRVLVGRAVAEETVLADRWPQHLLSRDYVRRTVGAALDAGWDAPGGVRDLVSPPYGSVWPALTRTDDEIEALGGPPEYRYGSITHSVMSNFGDFHKYVLRHHLSYLAPGADDEPVLAVAARRIVDRVLELGWDPERHGLYDRHRSRELNDRDPTERLGKKYQWIALHETLGAIVDNIAVGGRWGGQERPYDNPSAVSSCGCISGG